MQLLLEKIAKIYDRDLIYVNEEMIREGFLSISAKCLYSNSSLQIIKYIQVEVESAYSLTCFSVRGRSSKTNLVQNLIQFELSSPTLILNRLELPSLASVTRTRN